ncbi:MAG: DUF433 domain-containing protein [Candidatus Tumulicola sp.]
MIFQNPEAEVREEVLSGQAILEIPLRVVSGNMEGAVRGLSERDASLVKKFERNRNIARNEVVIAGTRIPVRSVKTFADAGYSADDIRNEYPTLAVEDVRAAIAYQEAA